MKTIADVNATILACEAAQGRTIEVVRMLNDVLQLVFVDGSELLLEDCGQDCCELRYMTCDDDLTQFTGACLVNVSTAPVPHAESESEDDVHEVQFLHVRTTDGVITCETHNEHNGYYGGFNVIAKFTAGS